MTRARIAVTTTSDRYAVHAPGLRAVGLDPVMLPCIEVVPANEELLDRARAEAAEVDWMLVTSARTVSVLWPEGGMPPIRVAAVGALTARAVRQAGGKVEIVGDGGGAQIVKQLDGGAAAGSFFFPHASGADMATVSKLEERGEKLVSTAVYETRPIPPGDDPVDGAMFGSPSAVDGWLLSRDLERIAIGAIGPTTSSALRRHGRTPDVVPGRPSFHRLAQSMADHLRERSSL